MKRFGFYTIFVIGIFLTVLVETVSACECHLPTVCQAYSRAEAVFTGSLAAYSRYTENGVTEVRADFEVIEVYKGTVGKTVRVRFAPGECGPTLETGKRYFVYKDKDDGTPLDRYCNRTTLLSNDLDDLAYARAFSTSRPTYTIEGAAFVKSISSEQKWNPDREKIRVIVEGGKERFEKNLGEDGFYSFTVTKNTKYSIRFLLPFKAKIASEKPFTVMKTDEGSKIEFTTNFKPNACFYDEYFFQYVGPVMKR